MVAASRDGVLKEVRRLIDIGPSSTAFGVSLQTSAFLGSRTNTFGLEILAGVGFV